MAPSVALLSLLVYAALLSPVSPVAKYYASARIESCSGCSLNQYPDVMQFIFYDVPEYENVEFVHIYGAVPELVLFNENDEEIERLPLSRLTREECNDLLVTKGFTKAVPVKDET